MSEETLSDEELDSLLEGAEIISEESSFQKKEKSVQIQSDTSVHPTKSPVQFSTKVSSNAELLMDVSLNITVELGRTHVKVKDILALGEGSIIELPKPANEPVDLLVNNRLIARGEVVVIDENFGTRVTQIVTRLENLHEKS